MRFSHAVLAASAVSTAAGAASLCSKYTTALLMEDTPANQALLLTLIVKTALIGPFTGKGTPNPDIPGNLVDVPGIVGADSPLIKYFDGSMAVTNVGGMPKKINWLDGATNPDKLASDVTYAGTPGSNTETLASHLVSYFGLLLMCDVGEKGYPAYAGESSQYSVHEFMKIDETEFTYFVQQVGLAAASFGAAKSDITGIATALNDTFGMRCSPPAAVDAGAELQAICTASDCPLAKGAVCSQYGGGSSGGGGGGGSGGGGSDDSATGLSFSKTLTGIVGFMIAAFAWL